jgi:hypothetical protein
MQNVSPTACTPRVVVACAIASAGIASGVAAPLYTGEQS